MNVRRCLALGTVVASLAVPAVASAQNYYVPAMTPAVTPPCAHPVQMVPQGIPVVVNRGWDHDRMGERGIDRDGDGFQRPDFDRDARPEIPFVRPLQHLVRTVFGAWRR